MAPEHPLRQLRAEETGARKSARRTPASPAHRRAPRRQSHTCQHAGTIKAQAPAKRCRRRAARQSAPCHKSARSARRTRLGQREFSAMRAFFGGFARGHAEGQPFVLSGWAQQGPSLSRDTPEPKTSMGFEEPPRRWQDAARWLHAATRQERHQLAPKRRTLDPEGTPARFDIRLMKRVMWTKGGFCG